MPPAERVECPHAARCPGCPLIGLPLEVQLDAKASRVARALAPYASLRGVAPAPVRAAREVAGYRTRAKLVVAPGPRLGLFARDGHDVLDLPGCRVLAPALADAAAALRALLGEPGLGPALRADGDGPGRLRAVDLRELDDAGGAGVLATLVLRAPGPPEAELAAAAERLAKALPTLRGVAVSLHDGRSPQLLGSAPRAVRGPPLHRDRPGPGAPDVLVSHGAFVQAHRAQAAALQAELLRALGDLGGRRVLELHAGSGALALALARAGARVVAVESFAPAAGSIGRAAREQHLAGVEVRTGTAESSLPELRAERARFEIGIANPPRRGIAPGVRAALAELCTEAIVYVSCEPETLARDLAHLAELGWGAVRLAPFDLMPQTAEVECVAWLRRAPPPPLRVLHEDALLLAVEKPPLVSVEPHLATALSLLARVRAQAGAERAVVLAPCDPDASGVALFARRPEHAPALEAALAGRDGRRTDLALVRGVARARGRVARTSLGELRYRRLAVAGGHALLEVSSRVRRADAVCRLLAAVGEPVLGDDRHGHPASNRHLAERHFLDRPFLHCASVELSHPGTGRRLRVDAPLAPDLAAVLARLGVDPTRTGVASRCGPGRGVGATV